MSNLKFYKMLSRRKLLTSSAITIYSSFFYACKTKKNKKTDPEPSTQYPPEIEKKETTKTTVVTTPEPNKENVQENPKSSCIQPNTIDLTKIPFGAEKYSCKRRVYGRKYSAIIAIQPQFVNNEIQDIFVVSNTGGILAQRLLSDFNNRKNNGLIRPIIFDNIDLSNCNDFVLVFFTSEGLYFKYLFPQVLEYNPSFKNISVKALDQKRSNPSFPPALHLQIGCLSASDNPVGYCDTTFSTDFCFDPPLDNISYCNIMGDSIEEIDPKEDPWILGYVYDETTKSYEQNIFHFI